MWIAYLIPKQDVCLVEEDGIAFVSVGNTEDEAKTNVRAKYDSVVKEDEQRAVELGMPPEPLMKLEDFYTLHTNEI